MKLLRLVFVASISASFFGLAANADGVSRLANLSSRAQVGSGDAVLISGLVVGPGGPKTVLIRALGPALLSQGVAGALVDPILSLHDNTGAVLATNDNWEFTDAATMARLGAFPLLPGSKDAALVRTLSPGSYTALVKGVAGGVGISLLEVYEFDPASGRLLNLSTRAQVGVGENLLISGFVISGSAGNRRLLVRAAGPALSDLRVSGALADPTLRVVNVVTGLTLASNDNWGTPTTSSSADASTLSSAFAVSGAFAFANGSKDSAVIVTAPPGLYSVSVTGVANSTGVALVEVYDLTVEDSRPGVSVSASKPTTDESAASPGEFTFFRSGDLSSPLSVSYSIGGTASAGSDYNAIASSVVFATNVSTVTIPLVARADALVEGTETVTLTLQDGGTTYSVSSYTPATISILDLAYTLFVSHLQPQSIAVNSSASGTATILLGPDGTTASVSLSFSNLSSAQTVAYVRLGNAGEVGVELIRMPAGQVDGILWTIRPSSAFSVSDIVQALRDGQVFVRVETTNFPGGELRGTFIQSAGSQDFSAPPPPPSFDLTTISDRDAARFLTQATFGPNKAGIDALKTKGYAAWLNEQFSKPTSVHRDAVMADFAANNAGGQSAVDGVNTRPGSAHRQAAWWKIALTGDDQLRQRVAFALSEIFVISDVNGTISSRQEAAAHYYDLLARNAFGNFRTLLEEVTLSPMMGIYLSQLRNARSTSATGAQPDENYAREIMQLFSIGLHELQPDGTLKLDSQSLPVPTYDQTTVTEMAKVFTGWAYHNTNPTTSNFRTSPADYFNPMTLYSGWHDVTAKKIVGGVTLVAGRTGTQDLQETLDALFNHPNTGPFISRFLIQRLVTSSPNPAYVYRVAKVFANNGSGVRGDLQAVVRAILTDYEARSLSAATGAGYGKLKEPLLRVTGLLRAIGHTSSTGRYPITNGNSQLGQSALSAPSVFNFFEPNFVQAGVLATAGLHAPEFQILTAATAMSTPNYLYSFIVNSSYQNITLDFTDLLPLATDSAKLIDRLSLLLAGNSMSTGMQSRMATALAALPTSATPTDRVRTALYLTATSAESAVQQ